MSAAAKLGEALRGLSSEVYARLRAEIAEMVASGASDDKVRAYLVRVAGSNRATWSGGAINETNIVEALTRDAAILLANTTTFQGFKA